MGRLRMQADVLLCDWLTVVMSLWRGSQRRAYDLLRLTTSVDEFLHSGLRDGDLGAMERRTWLFRILLSSLTVRDNYDLKSHKYECITTYQPDPKSNPNPNPSPNPATKQHATVNMQLNIVACPTYPDKFMRDMLLHRLFDSTLASSRCHLSTP